jgi:hypothetical protein
LAASNRLALTRGGDQAKSAVKVYPSAWQRMTVTSATWINPDVMKMAIAAASEL